MDLSLTLHKNIPVCFYLVVQRDIFYMHPHGIAATRGVYMCCWFLALTVTRIVTVVAEPGPLARLTPANRNVRTSTSPVHAVARKTHAAGKMRMQDSTGGQAISEFFPHEPRALVHYQWYFYI